MTNEKRIAYKKAHVELDEIIENLTEEEKNKIPKVFLANLKNDMDENYEFKLDKSKGLDEQNLMIETQALLVEIYKKYLAQPNEKEMWEKYDTYYFNKVEDKKREQYSPEGLFNREKSQTEENQEEKTDLIEYKENIFKRILNSILKKLKII